MEKPFQLEEEENNIVNFIPKIITGGKEPPSESNCWLDSLAIGTVFYAQSKTQPMDPLLRLYYLYGRQGRVTILHSNEAKDKDGMHVDIPVNSIRFCNNWLLYEQIAIINTQQQEEDKDGSNRNEGDGSLKIEEVDGPSGS